MANDFQVVGALALPSLMPGPEQLWSLWYSGFSKVCCKHKFIYIFILKAICFSEVFLSYFSVFLKLCFVVNVELVAGNNCTGPMPLAPSMRCSDPWSLGPSCVFGMSVHFALDMFLTCFRKLEVVMRVAVFCQPLNKKNCKIVLWWCSCWSLLGACRMLSDTQVALEAVVIVVGDMQLSSRGLGLSSKGHWESVVMKSAAEWLLCIS